MRYIDKSIAQDLQSKMVFLVGPRQVGKTTLARQLLEQADSGLYLNWDDPIHRRQIRAREWTTSDRLIVLDEVHKMSAWRNFLKGTYDTQREAHQFLITGSARLDVYRRGGDSLFGRYHKWRLHPFCMAELAEMGHSPEENFENLLKFGGFPEPLFKQNLTQMRRWRSERRELILRYDIRDLEDIRQLDVVEALFLALTQRVGSPIVYSNLARDLEVAPKTVKAWLTALDRLFLCFLVEPYAGRLPRTWIKPPKVYVWNQTDVEEAQSGAALENLVALHLLKRIHYRQDALGTREELRYIRDREGHEVDFVILENGKPSVLIEVKESDTQIHSGLIYFQERLQMPKAPKLRAIQLVRQAQKPDVKKLSSGGSVEILPLLPYLSRPLSDGF